jgi:ankyrin repeat protein
LHAAAQGSHVESVRLGRKKNQTCLNELKNYLLLEKDKYGYIACHQAARFGSLKALETLWNWPKEAKLTQMNFC